ncbi:MAG: TIGR03986 family CRISPR-associated RAMP protein [Chloroflexota bacterium]
MPRPYRRGRARAPYNFVPLETSDANNNSRNHVCQPMVAYESGNDLPSHAVYNNNLKSGYFTVRVNTVTPLYIRGMLTRQQVEENNKRRQAKQTENLHSTSEFFSHDGKTPLIPGSSLKGMLRSLVEVITFGKMHFVSDSPKIYYRAVAAPRGDSHGVAYEKIIGRFSKNVRAGYIVNKDGKWYIRPAKKILGDHIGKIKDIKRDQHTKKILKIFIQEVRNLKHFIDEDYVMASYPVVATKDDYLRVKSPQDGQRHNAYLICTGNMAETGSNADSPRSSYHLIGLPNDNVDLLEIPNHIVRDYLDGLSPFQKGDSDQSKSYMDSQRGILQHGKPVFYVTDPDKRHIVSQFGHTRNFRISHQIVDTQIEHDYNMRAVNPRDKVPSRLLDANLIDYADAMFGYISEKDQERSPVAYAGRISVTSATPTSQISLPDEEITPKILGSPKPTTYQHYLEQPDAATDNKNQLHHYGTQNATSRGHKQYWRQQGINLDKIKAKPEDIEGKEKVTTQIKPLKKGEFEFKVYFDNLNPQELGALAWALTLDNDLSSDKLESYHMLGMGKPHGMGVVELHPRLTLIDRSHRYANLFDEKSNGAWQLGKKSGDMSEFIAVFKDAVHQHTGVAFDDHWRIQQLRAMLRLQPQHSDFTYMALEEFRERIVLPYPTELDKSQR